MGLKDGLLCLLAAGENYGYELKSQLESATADTWQVNIGQVYTTLQRMERDGLVVHRDAEEGRVLYSLTDDGHEAAREWMRMPVDLAVAGRDEISLKILMAVRSGIEDPRRVVERQRGSTMSLIQDYTALRAEDSREEFGWLLYLDRLIFSAEAELRWLDKVESRLESRPPESRSASAASSEPETEEVGS